MHRFFTISSIFIAALLSRADAAVIHSDIQNLTIPYNFDGIYLNIVSGDTSPAEPSNWESAPTINLFFGGVGIVTDDFLRPAINPQDQVASLSLGTRIDSTLTYAGSPYGSDGHIDTGSGGFTIAESGYLGFSFRITGDEPEPYYGWMRFTPSTTGNAMIHEWAYDNVAGQGIDVGTIPEPSVPLLAVITGALACLRHNRRPGHSQRASNTAKQ